MKKTTKTLAATIALLGSLGAAGTVDAKHDEVKNDKVAKYTYSLDSVQQDFAGVPTPTGTTKVMVLPNGNVKVGIEASNLVPNAPHAQHLHDKIGPETSTCPTPADDANGDGIVSVLEGAPAYGGIVLSLTTTGDFSSASALALDRFPVADADGNLSYSRQFPASTMVGDTTLGEIAGTAQVVVHGIDVNANGVYDFEAGPSSLTDAAPIEATAPALCGGIEN